MAQDEQPVDLDALQAQIDLSMSLTEELVSSWISASPKISKGSNVNGFGSNAAVPSGLRAHEKLEKELQEYMKRPSRLGVGAPIPESSAAAASREAARLKQKLGVTPSSKRKRDDGELAHTNLSTSTSINGVTSSSTNASKLLFAANKSNVHSHERGLSDDDREERKGATDRAAAKKAKMLKARLDPFAVGGRGGGSGGKGKGKGEASESNAKSSSGLKGQIEAKDSDKGEGRSAEGEGQYEVVPQSNRTKGGDDTDSAMDIDELAQSSITRSPLTASNSTTKGDRNRDPSNTNPSLTSGELPSAQARHFSNTGTEHPSSTGSSKASAVQAPIPSQVTFTPESTIPTAALELDISQRNGKTCADGANDKDVRTLLSAANKHSNIHATAEDGLIANTARRRLSDSDTDAAKAVIGAGVSPEPSDSKNKAGATNMLLAASKDPDAITTQLSTNTNEATSNVNSSEPASLHAELYSKKKRKKKRRKADGAVAVLGSTATGLEATSDRLLAVNEIVHATLSNNSAILDTTRTGSISSIALDDARSRNPNATNSDSTSGVLNNNNALRAETKVHSKNIMCDIRGPHERTNSSVTLNVHSHMDMDNDNRDTPESDKHENPHTKSKEEESMIGSGIAAPTTAGHVDNQEHTFESKKSRKRKKKEREKFMLENEKVRGPSGMTQAPRLSDEGTAGAAEVHAGEDEDKDTGGDGDQEEWTGFGDEDEFEFEELRHEMNETLSAPPSPSSKRKRKRQRHKHGEHLPELSLPLLNLHGPLPKAEDEDVGGEDGDDNNIRQVATAADDVTDGSARRKKKRRRGKGKGTGTGLGQNAEGGHGVES